MLLHSSSSTGQVLQRFPAFGGLGTDDFFADRDLVDGKQRRLIRPLCQTSSPPSSGRSRPPCQSQPHPSHHAVFPRTFGRLEGVYVATAFLACNEEINVVPDQGLT